MRQATDYMPTRLSCWTGLGAVFLWLYFVQPMDASALAKACALIGLVALGTIPFELQAIRHAKRGLFMPVCGTRNHQRVALKLLGGAITFGAIALCYYVFPEYNTDFYAPFYSVLRWILPAYLIVGSFSLWYFDNRQEKPEEDIYYQLGSMFFFQKNLVPKVAILQHVAQWAVKAFFLPLMFVYSTHHVQNGLSFQGEFPTWFESAYNFIYCIDIGFVVVGYLTASRLFDSHLRSADPTGAGWVSALLCYQPFWSLVGASYLLYWYPPTWGVWLADNPFLYRVWGLSIIVSLTLYVWATIVFGSRFSNLTHRGIINFGPYAFLKHPAYVGKMISFLLIQVPWAAQKPEFAIKGLLAWSGLCLVYYVRAKTEERHLRMVDSTYAQYESELVARRQKWLKILRGE